MKHWHIWLKVSKTKAIRESTPYRNTATPARIINREERFRAYGGRTEMCDDPECLGIGAKEQL